MNLLKKIRTKLKLRTRLLKFISSWPIIHKYILYNKSTTFKKWCTEIESFPTNDKIISRDWYLLIRPPEITQRKLPISLDDIEVKKLQEYYSNTTHYKIIPEVFFSCLSKAKIFNKNNYDGFFPLSVENNLFSHDVLYNNVFIEERGILNTIFFPPFTPRLRYYPGDYCLLATPNWPFNYYHWLLEILPKLSLLERFDQLEHIPLILHKELNAFQKESLQLAGVFPQKMVCLEQGYYQVDKLYFPSYLSGINNISPHTISWLRTRFLNKDFSRESPPESYLYITRSDASIRRVINEDEIIEFLKNIGFEIISLAKMPFVEQIKIFSRAKVVIAPHGAGLTNIVFAPPNTTIIEMFPETKNQVDGSYWILADTCGHNYAFLTGSVAALDTKGTQDTQKIIATGWSNREDRNRDFYVSLDKLKGLLDMLL